MGSFSVFHWLIFVVVMLAIVAAVRAGRSGRAMFCTTCGHEGPDRMQTRGSMGIEILLWLLFIVPGLIYSLWRLTTRRPVCQSCGGASLVPPGSPVAVKMRAELANSANTTTNPPS